MRSKANPDSIEPSQVPFSRRVHTSLVNSREWVPPREQILRKHTGHLHFGNACSYFMACFFQLLVAPWYIYQEGWNIYWYGRFLSTFAPGYAFVALMVGAAAALILHYVPTEILTLLAVHLYTSIAMSISVGHLSRKQRHRFLTFWSVTQLATKRAADKDPITVAELTAGVHLDDHELLELTPDLLTTLYERDEMAAVVREHEEVESELLEIEREEQDIAKYESSPVVRLSPRSRPGEDKANLSYRQTGDSKNQANRQRSTAHPRGTASGAKPCPPAGCDVPEPIREGSAGAETEGSRSRNQSHSGESPGGAGAKSRRRTSSRSNLLAHASTGSSHSVPPSVDAWKNESKTSGPAGNDKHGQHHTVGASYGGGVPRAPMRRKSMIRQMLDSRVGCHRQGPSGSKGSGGSSAVGVERRFKHLTRTGTEATAMVRQADDSEASETSGRSRSDSESSSVGSQAGAHDDEDDLLDEDEGAIRGRNLVVGGGTKATAFLRYTFRAYVRCLQSEAQAALDARVRKKKKKLAKRRQKLLMSRRTMSGAVSVGASTVGKMLAPPPAPTAVEEASLPQSIDDVSSGDDSDGSHDSSGMIDNAFQRNEEDVAVWKEKTAAFAWVLPSRVAVEEIIQRASTGASISETDLLFTKITAIVVLLLPGISYALPGGTEQFKDGVLLWQRILIFIVACAGVYNLNYVNFRFLIRMVARARRKRELVNSVASMLDYGDALDARLPFVDVRLPRNVRSWAAMLDVLHNYDRYDSVNAAAPMSAFLGQSTVLMFVLTIACVLVAAGVVQVELSTFVVMVAYLILSAGGSITTLAIEAGTNFRLLKVSQKLAKLRSLMQADLVSCTATYGRMRGYGDDSITSDSSPTFATSSSYEVPVGAPVSLASGSAGSMHSLGLPVPAPAPGHEVYVIRQQSGATQGQYSVEVESVAHQSAGRQSVGSLPRSSDATQQTVGVLVPGDGRQAWGSDANGSQHQLGLATGFAGASDGKQQSNDSVQSGSQPRTPGGSRQPPAMANSVGAAGSASGAPGAVRSSSTSEARDLQNPGPRRRVRIVSAGDALHDKSDMSSGGTPSGGSSTGGSVRVDRSGSSSGSAISSKPDESQHGGHARSEQTRSSAGSGQQRTMVQALRDFAGLEEADGSDAGQEFPTGTRVPPIGVPSNGQRQSKGHGPMLGHSVQFAAHAHQGSLASAPSAPSATSLPLRSKHQRRMDSIHQEKAALQQMLRSSVDLVEARSVEIALGGMYTRLFGGVVIDFALLRGIVGLISGATLSVVTLLVQDNNSLLGSIA